MRLHELHDEAGRVFAFQIPSLGCSRSRVCRIAARIPGARIIRPPKWLSRYREEDFCEFEIDGVTFVAWEPFGDSDRFWIGASPSRWVPQIDRVREAFERA